jgi:hypothetical protein
LNSLSHPTFLMTWLTICASQHRERVVDSEIGSVGDGRKLLPPDQQFQIDFKRLSVEKDHWGGIPLGSGGAIQFELPDEGLGRILEGPCVLANFDVAATVPAFNRA